MRSAIIAAALMTALSACAPASRGPTYPPSRFTAAPAPATGAAECDSWLQDARDISIPNLYSQIQQLRLKKDEYETTAAFNERAASALAGKSSLLREIDGRPRVVATAPVSADYSADKNSLRIITHPVADELFNRSFLIEEKSYKVHDFVFVPTVQTEGAVGSYTGSNAFGVTRRVTEVRGVEYGLALTDLKKTSGTWVRQKGLEISMSPDRARALRGRVGVKIIADLVPPGALAGTDPRGPTVSNPVDRTVSLRYVTVSTLCAGLIAMDTGEVLKRLY